MTKLRSDPLATASERDRREDDRLWHDYYQSGSCAYVTFDEWLEIMTTPWPVADAEAGKGDAGNAPRDDAPPRALDHVQTPRKKEKSVTTETPIPAIFRNAQWAVTAFGLETVNLGWDIPFTYLVPASRLAELHEPERGIADWPVHMAAKSWVDLPAFIEAWRQALSHHHPTGIERIDFAATEATAYAISRGEDPRWPRRSSPEAA